MTRVAVVTTEPTASRAPQFDSLARRADLDIFVFYAAETIQRRTWTLALDHPHEILRGPRLPLTRVLQHDYPITPSLWRRLDQGRFDCVVVWGWSTFAAQLAIAWCRIRRVPYVLFAESHLEERRATWARIARRKIVPFAVRGAAAWLATGTLAREHLVHFGAESTRVWTFANTIDVEALSANADRLRGRRADIRTELGFVENDIVALHVGRLLPLKAVDVLIDAVARVPDVRLLVVGEGPERDALEQHARQKHVNAIFTGEQRGDRLVERYVAADIFCLLSRRETWGVVVNEAAVCGLPLILSDGVGAAVDLLNPGENGELVRAGDPVTTAAALARLAADPQLRAEFGRRSKEIAASWSYAPSNDAFAAAVGASVRQ